MSMYAYDFQTSGFEAIDKVRAVVESQNEWDRSDSLKEARANSAAAAKRFGYTGLMNAEQKALREFLINSKAGLHIATYAWGIYTDMKASTQAEFSSTTGLVTA